MTEGMFLLEHKATTSQQITLKHQWLEKITKEALETGRLPVLCLSMCGERWFVVPEYVFDMIPKE